MSGKKDLACLVWRRKHGPAEGWQWALLTYDVCIDTGWTTGTRGEARRMAATARRKYLDAEAVARASGYADGRG